MLLPRRTRKRLILPTVGVSFWILLGMSAIAQEQFSERFPEATLQARSVRFVPRNPPPPPGIGTPRTTYGTGSRGDCLQTSELPAFTHLVGEPGMELTVQERPSFWAYLPYTSAEADSAKFLLQSETATVYEQAIALPGSPGVIEIVLPETVAPLAVGTTYRWYLEVSCASSEAAAAAPESVSPATVTGTVQRVETTAELDSRLAAAQSPLEETIAYAESYLWYDTLTSLAQQRLADLENAELQEIWKTMLSNPELGLEDWAQAPLIEQPVE